MRIVERSVLYAWIIVIACMRAYHSIPLFVKLILIFPRIHRNLLSSFEFRKCGCCPRLSFTKEKKWQRSPRILSRRVRIAKISTLTITTKKSNDHNRQNRSDCVSNASSRVAGITIILYFESERM